MNILACSISALLLAMLATPVQSAPVGNEDSIKELAYGVSLYQFFQHRNLAAITEITAAKQRGRLDRQANDAALLLGSLYYEFGLPDESEKIFVQMLGADESATVKNRIWFNLAKVQYDRGNYQKARQFLSRIDDGLSPQRRAQRQYMLSNIFSQEKNYQQARAIVQNMDDENPWSSYARYNLGVSLLQDQDDQQWLQQLLRIQTGDRELQALQDSARYILGLSALRENLRYKAVQYFNDIHMDSPLSNKALLATGWSWYKQADIEQAEKYWKVLLQRNESDVATQEAMIALAEVYEKKGNKVQAIKTYQQADTTFEQFLSELDDVIDAIRRQAFIEKLIKQPVMNGRTENLPHKTITYLYDLISSNAFQQAIKNYQQLLEMQKSLNRWQQNIPVFELMLKQRKTFFLEKKDQLDIAQNEQRLLDLRSQRDRLTAVVNSIEQKQNFQALANENESEYLKQLKEISGLIEKLQPGQDVSEAAQQYRVLTGLLDYQLETEFPARFWALRRQLQLLDRALEKTAQATQSLVESAKRNEQKLQDFQQRIAGQQMMISRQGERVEQLLERQRKQINAMAINVILQRKQHTQALRLSARYSATRLLDEIASAASLQQEAK